MSVLLSKSSMYGLRAALYIASLKNDSYIPVKNIAEELNLSFHFLAKILQTLTQEGVLRSFRGPNGGVALARDAGEIKVSEIVDALEGPKQYDHCLIGLPGCGVERPCPLHDKWTETQRQIRSMFEDTTLAEQAERIEELGVRLS